MNDHEYTISPHDELLVVRCQLGERKAFPPLIQRWAGPLRRYAARVTSDPAAADDLVQDIWLAAITGLGRLRDARKFRSWIFGIAHRRMMDWLRLRHRSVIDTFDQLPEPSAENDEALEEAFVDLEQGLSLLPCLEREVLTLFYLEELSLIEISEALTVPVGTVKSRLFRARRNLKQHLCQQEQRS